jgi:hypothetical protein
MAALNTLLHQKQHSCSTFMHGLVGLQQHS